MPLTMHVADHVNASVAYRAGANDETSIVTTVSAGAMHSPATNATTASHPGLADDRVQRERQHDQREHPAQLARGRQRNVKRAEDQPTDRAADRIHREQYSRKRRYADVRGEPRIADLQQAEACASAGTSSHRRQAVAAR